jgi:hypothetical protein
MRYDVYYWSGNGYFVTDENGLIVFGPGYGTYLPEWGNAQLMGAYFQYEGSATKQDAVKYIKRRIFASARKRSRMRRRRA